MKARSDRNHGHNPTTNTQETTVEYETKAIYEDKGKKVKMEVFPEDVTSHTVEIFTLGSHQVFGVPYPIKDEDHIEIYSGVVRSKDFDLLKDPI